MIRFDKRYFVLFIILLLLEIFIAIYIHDSIIRPFVGDLLVVILIYSFAMSFIRWNKMYISVWVLISACIVELGQYYHLVEVFGIDNKILRVALWNSFDRKDILAYILGIGLVIVAEKYIDNRDSLALE